MPKRIRGDPKPYDRLPSEMTEKVDEFRASLHGVSEGTKENYLGRITWFGVYLLEKSILQFEKVSKKDINLFLSGYKNPNTRNLFIQIFREFYKDLKPEVVKHLRIQDVEIEQITPSDILTPDEVIALAREAGKKREMMKPLILILFESGCRISELLNLKWGDVIFSTVKDVEGKRKLIATLHFKRSKGGVRKEPVTCVMFAADLKKWVDNHPSKQPEAYLFPSPKYLDEPVSAGNVGDVLWYAGQRLGMKKKLNPHFLRHSSLSYLANSKGYSDVMLKIRAGWTSTQMASRYIHTGAEIERRVYLEKMGLVEADKEPEKQITSRTCLHCQTENSYLNDVCDVCLFPLDPEQYQKEVSRRRNVEQLLEKGKKVLTPEIEASLRNRAKTLSHLGKLEREDLVEQYLEMLLSGFVKSFLASEEK